MNSSDSAALKGLLTGCMTERRKSGKTDRHQRLPEFREPVQYHPMSTNRVTSIIAFFPHKKGISQNIDTTQNQLKDEALGLVGEATSHCHE